MVTTGFGLIGFADDYMKVTRRNSKGVPGKVKLLVAFAIALVAAWLIMDLSPAGLRNQLAIPFCKTVLINLSFFFIPFAALVMVGASNAVNLTDGLDGLAIVPVMIASGVFGLISYLVGNAVFANYLPLHAVPGAGELRVFCAAPVGASLGFLWYNAPPAMIFMGDTGSLAMGGALGSVAVITKNEARNIINMVPPQAKRKRSQRLAAQRGRSATVQEWLMLANQSRQRCRRSKAPCVLPALATLEPRAMSSLVRQKAPK